jgi:hypothetical protein
MSKQSAAKKMQGYMQKPILRNCANCKHFKMESETISSYSFNYVRESNLRCGIGDFKVGKTSACNLWEWKER